MKRGEQMKSRSRRFEWRDPATGRRVTIENGDLQDLMRAQRRALEAAGFRCHVGAGERGRGAAPAA